MYIAEPLRILMSALALIQLPALVPNQMPAGLPPASVIAMDCAFLCCVGLILSLCRTGCVRGGPWATLICALCVRHWLRAIGCHVLVHSVFIAVAFVDCTTSPYCVHQRPPLFHLFWVFMVAGTVFGRCDALTRSVLHVYGVEGPLAEVILWAPRFAMCAEIFRMTSRTFRGKPYVWEMLIYMWARVPLVIGGAFWPCDILDVLDFSPPLASALVAAGFLACSPLIEPFVSSAAEPSVGAPAEPVPAPARAVARSTPAQRMWVRIHRPEE